MRKGPIGFQLSASDLASHLGCRHLTRLDLAVAEGLLTPPTWRDPTLAVLQERGLELEHLRAQGCRISEPDADDDGWGLERTLAAMRDGLDVIYQAVLRTGHWYGRADFLQRVDQPNSRGPWHTKWWTRSSLATPAPVPFCNSVSIRKWSARFKGTCRSGCMLSYPVEISSP
jgi:hypothetical protein